MGLAYIFFILLKNKAFFKNKICIKQIHADSWLHFKTPAIKYAAKHKKYNIPITTYEYIYTGSPRFNNGLFSDCSELQGH